MQVQIFKWEPTANVIVKYNFVVGGDDGGGDNNEDITATATPADSNQGTATAIKDTDDTYTLTATPANNYMLDYWECAKGSGTYGDINATFSANNKIYASDDEAYSNTLTVTLDADSEFTAHFKPVHFILPDAPAVVVPYDPEGSSGTLRIGAGTTVAPVREGTPAEVGFKFILPSSLSVAGVGMFPTISISLYEGDSTDGTPFFSRSVWGTYSATDGAYLYVRFPSIEPIDVFTAKVWYTNENDAVTRTYTLTDPDGNPYILSSSTESARDTAVTALDFILAYCQASPGYALIQSRAEAIHTDAKATVAAAKTAEDIDKAKLDAIGALLGLVNAGTGGSGSITITASAQKFTPDEYVAKPTRLTLPADYTATETLDALLRAANPDEVPSIETDGWVFTVNNTLKSGDAVTFNDGDVVRWQYAGSDVNIEAQPDKDKLTAKIAEIRAAGTQAEYSTYNSALAVLAALNSTEEQVTVALLALTPTDVLDIVADDGGTIEEPAEVGGNYTVKANEGLVIDEIWIDGARLSGVQGLTEYTTETPPTRGIFATFAYTITIDTPEEGGSLSVKRGDEAVPNGSVVRGGEALTIKATPEDGKELDELITTGLRQTGPYSYIVTSREAPRVAVTFKVSEGDAAEPVDYEDALADVLEYIKTKVTNPTVNTTSGEWAVLALARAGLADETFVAKYLENVKTYIGGNTPYSVDPASGKVILDSKKYTENSRVVVGLTAVGQDAAALPSGGDVDYDLVSALTDTASTVWQGMNGPIWALIALDSNAYLPDSVGLRAYYLQYILAHEKTNAGWDLEGETSGGLEADTTGMALQALAPYYKMTESAYGAMFAGASAPAHSDIVEAVTNAVAALRVKFDEDGGFRCGIYDVSSESAVQVLVALCSLEYDGTADGGFIRDVARHLLSYANEDGSFRHEMFGKGGNAQMSTEQAAYALVAYDRYVNNERSLYDMGDAFVKSTDAGVKTLAVNYGINLSVPATEVTDGGFKATIPFGETLPTAGGAIIVTPNRGAHVTAGPDTNDGGKTWTFTVTAEDGATTATYTLTVAVAPNPNAADIDKAKYDVATAAAGWMETTLNTSEDIRAWLQGVVDALGLSAAYGVTATVTVDDFTVAVNGTSNDTEQLKEGRPGSYSVSVFLTNNEGVPVPTTVTAVSGGEITRTQYKSSEAGITGVTVGGVSGSIAGETITVVLPFGTEELPTDVAITTSDKYAQTSAPEPSNDGATWTFTVTSEDGTETVTYAIVVSIAPDPAVGSIAAVNAAKSVIENHTWTAPVGTEDIQTWVEAQLLTLNLNEVTVAATVSDIVPATDGTFETPTGIPGSFTATFALSKGSPEDETLYESTAQISGTIAAAPYEYSRDASITGITVGGFEATLGENNSYTVEVPAGTEFTPESFTVALSDPKATVGAATPINNGAAWTIEVTAEDGTTARTYTVSVTVAAAANEANAKLVAAAKAYLETEAVFEVSMASANTETAVQAWLADRLTKLPLAGVSAAVNTVSVTPAIAGTEAEPDGTRGEFTATLTLLIGDGETLAEIAAEIGGAIAATKYTPFTGGPRGDNITVTFRLVGASLTKGSAEIDMKASLEKGENDLWNGSEYQTWIATRSYTMREGDTNYDLFTQALRNAGLQSIGAEGNYVSTIYAPTYYGGHKLSEFTNGKYSGWMYTVNGKHPGYGLMEYPLSDGDIVIWHYVNDYRYEVGDWFNDLEYPALGDGGQWNKWLDRSVADTDPPRDGSVAPGVEQESEYETTAIDEPKTALGEFGGGSIVATETVTAEVKTENGRATAAIEAEIVTEAVTKAKETVEAAKADGAANAKAEVKIVAKADSSSGTVRSAEVDIPAEAIRAVADAQDLVLTIESDVSTITLDAATLTAIAETAKDGDTIKIAAESVDSAEALNDRQQARAGGNPVVELHISVGGAAITNLGGTVTVSLPYMPESDVAPDDYDLLTVYYLDDDGNITEMKGAKYDAATGSITFATTHFSKFFVTEWISPFGDITKGDWYYRAARYAYSNDLITGTTDTTFAPQTTLTRAMLITILARDAGIDTSGGETWYSKAVDWGMSNNLTDGTNINAPITREQFATLLYRYAQFTIQNSQFTIAADAADLSAYTDTADISDWAADAMAWAVANGLITGRTTTTLAPKGNTTRAETATLLQRYLENIA